MRLTSEQYKKLLAYQQIAQDNQRELAPLEKVKPISNNNQDGDYLDGGTQLLKDLADCTVLQIEIMLQNCEIIDLNADDTIQVGSRVRFSVNCNGETVDKVVTIVELLVPGMIFSDNLSVKSPLGKALLDRHEGETFPFTQPGGQTVEVTICEIIRYQKKR